MRRVFCFFLLCFLCTACASEEELLSPAIEFRTELVQAGGCSFTADVTADFTDSIQAFSLDCTSDDADRVYMTVTAPETLAGITATATQDGGQITYDGMAMDFGLLANGNVIPAAAPAIIHTCWTGEYISSAGQEGELYRVTFEKDFDEKKLIVDTWFEKSIPICAEICYNGERIIKIAISNFSFN